MDWTFDGQEPDFMDFDVASGDMWDFDGPLDFEDTDLNSFHNTTLGNNAFINSMHIDPALVSSEPNDEAALFAPSASQKMNERRRPARSDFFIPHLKTELTRGSRMIFGQVTPPSSASSSPHTAPLDTIDPTEVMPDTEPPPESIRLNRTTSKPSKSTTSGTLGASTTPTSSKPTSTSTSISDLQTTAPVEGPAVKPKSKRGRKKKILAPAARDAQRARTLARNRAAAQRCRQRKKVEHAALETRARGLARDRAALHTLVGGLRDELLSLKGQMLRHASCTDTDGGVAAYVQQQREMLMRGLPEDEQLAPEPTTEDDHEFLRELGIDPQNPMEDAEEDDENEEEEDDNEAEAEATADDQTEPSEPADGSDEDEAAPLRMESAPKPSDADNTTRRLRARPRRTAKAKTSK